VHYFAKARKASAKSDPIDAESIMLYGLTMNLKPDSPVSPALKAVRELAERRDDLRRILVAEKNRLKAPGISSTLKAGIRAMIQVLNNNLKKNEQEMEKIAENEPSIKHPIEILTKEYGVGLISAITIYAAMPELGTLTRQTAGALAGLAPILRESGKFSGQRRIGGGRSIVRSALYLVAMTAIRKKGSPLQKFYINLKKAGKRKIVALTAVMRKLIVRFNTLLKVMYQESQICPAAS
jgi:transposase